MLQVLVDTREVSLFKLSLIFIFYWLHILTGSFYASLNLGQIAWISCRLPFCLWVEVDEYRERIIKNHLLFCKWQRKNLLISYEKSGAFHALLRHWATKANKIPKQKPSFLITAFFFLPVLAEVTSGTSCTSQESNHGLLLQNFTNCSLVRLHHTIKLLW